MSESAPNSAAAPAARPAPFPRTIDWDGEAIVIIDQTALPARERLLRLVDVGELVAAIRRLAVRGAPALGAAGALGAALAARQAHRDGWSEQRLRAEIARLREARPTAANLAWGVEVVSSHLGEGPEVALRRALEVLEADARANRRIGERGADLLTTDRRGALRIHTHCNAGALACVEWGTALGVVRALHERGLMGEVLVSETRPLLQGARLTAWELGRLGIAHRVVCDAAGPAMIAQGAVDAVVVGADRIAANGDVANKVGTFSLALAAAHAGVPMVVAAPEATIDRNTPSGSAISIELRDEEEVRRYAGVPTTPSSTRAHNPAFDVTPAELITAIVTEERVLHPGADPIALAQGGEGPGVPPANAG